MKILKLFPVLLLIALIGACSKEDKDGDSEDQQYFQYNPVNCPANPQFCTVDTNDIQNMSTFTAEITNVGGQDKLLIEADNVEITVDFVGVDNYSSDTTNLYVQACSYDGLLNPCYGIDNFYPYTGGYMQILKYDGNYIEGNIRYLLSYYDALDNAVKYGGLDNGAFKIKLK